jgi:3-hydroxy acid dehydrogenase/malonic semialdehyde reductase
MNRIILITGATSGIGKATASLFAQNGDHLILVGRRKERLEKLGQLLEEKNGIRVYPLLLDVCDSKAVFEAVEKLPEEWQAIDILVNNAGLALGRDSFQDADLQDMETMMQTNVNGLMYVSKAVVTGMVKRKSGHIINIGSVAAKEVYANGNAYCASKFAVDALSKGMRIDLLPLGIKVTAIHPGAVDTEFSLVRYKGDADKAGATYKGFRPLVAEDVAQSILYTANLPEHICINELTITCTAQADVHHFHKDK